MSLIVLTSVHIYFKDDYRGRNTQNKKLHHIRRRVFASNYIFLGVITLTMNLFISHKYTITDVYFFIGFILLHR